jgi:hypothetical protein
VATPTIIINEVPQKTLPKTDKLLGTAIKAIKIRYQ